MTENSKTTKIYLTSKVRMISESKLKLYSLIGNSLITWYSFCIIILALAQTAKVLSVAYSDVFFAGWSIAIFAASLLVYNGDLQKRAAAFRDCYLELQKLDNSKKSDAMKMREYSDIMFRYPNHSDRDYDDLLANAWRQNSELINSSGKILVSKMTLAFIAARKITFWIFVVVLFLGPIVIAVPLLEPGP